MQYLKCLFVTYVVLFFYNKMDDSARTKIKAKKDKLIKECGNAEKVQKKIDTEMVYHGTALLLIITTLIYILGSYMLW